MNETRIKALAEALMQVWAAHGLDPNRSFALGSAEEFAALYDGQKAWEMEATERANPGDWKPGAPWLAPQAQAWEAAQQQPTEDDPGHRCNDDGDDTTWGDAPWLRDIALKIESKWLIHVSEAERIARLVLAVAARHPRPVSEAMVRMAFGVIAAEGVMNFETVRAALEAAERAPIGHE